MASHKTDVIQARQYRKALIDARAVIIINPRVRGVRHQLIDALRQKANSHLIAIQKAISH